ncbi:uncharacterized protein LOC142612372 [Castanea sativa]|uniref:uncharacterized protein LOC142612372 n=1 Tax=Castanea sativa TaxID=21020 RepID=UPI003F6497B1
MRRLPPSSARAPSLSQSAPSGLGRARHSFGGEACAALLLGSSWSSGWPRHHLFLFSDQPAERDTTVLTLKKEISAVLSRYKLHIENIRGQGYDGASNMCGERNGLQALFLKECPYAYYVHCMAYRLQLALVIASREVKVVHQFYDHLTNIINIVVGSSKRNDELQYAQGEQIENMIVSNEIETGRRGNQIGTLQRAGDTRWGSHFQSICSLIKMFDATCKVINTISEEWVNYKQCGDAKGAYQVLTSFEFVLILHMMKEIMGIANILCQVLQQHSQDLLNAMHLVSTTKSLIQKLRDDG